LTAEVLKIAAQLVKDGDEHVKNTKNYIEAAFNYARAMNLFLEFQEHLDARKKPSLYDFCEKNITSLKKKLLELAKTVTLNAFDLEDNGDFAAAAKKHQDAIGIYQNFRESTTNSALIKLCDDNIQKLTSRVKQIHETIHQLKKEELEERKKKILSKLDDEKRRILALKKEIEAEKEKPDKIRRQEWKKELTELRDNLDVDDEKSETTETDLKTDIESLKKDLEDLL